MVPRNHPLAQRIADLVPINSLDPRLQEQALAQGELLEFKRKRTVFEAGARDPYTFYLLDGELELQAEDTSPQRMRAGDENARRALAQLQPRRYTAIALSTVQVFRIERAVLDHILSDEQVLEETSTGVEVLDDSESEDDWMSRLLSSELFTRLPHENIQRFFTELEPLEVAQGDVVVAQGTPGDYLYIVAEGRCAVARRAPGSSQELQLAVLKQGDTFGEESLISNSPRNASVTAMTPGMLMRLPRRAFEELVSNPTLKAVPWSEASQLVAAGARWLDVRFPDEHAANAVEGSINLPLNTLRLQAPKLPIDKTYIVICDTGARSSAAAFLLARMGFEACYLAGGLDRSPLGEGRQAPPPPPPEADEGASTTFEFEFVTGDMEEAEDDAEAAPAQDDETPGAEAAPAQDAQTPGAAAARAQDDETPGAAAAAQDDETPGAAAAAQAAPASGPAPESAAAARDAEGAAPAAAGAESTARGEHPPPAAAPAVDLTRVRAQIAQIKAERDKAAAYGHKAARAAKELKRRGEELQRSLKEERARREELDKALAEARADSERQVTLERSRLEGEREKLQRRLESVQAEHERDALQAGAERDKLQSRLGEVEARIEALLAEKEQAESLRVAAEMAFQEKLDQGSAEIQELRRGLDASEQATAEARERLGETEARLREAEARSLAVQENQEARAGEAEQALRDAEERVRAERARLEAERATLAQDAARQQRELAELEASLRGERAAVDKSTAAQHARAEELNAREMALADARTALDAEREQRHATLAASEEALAERERALSEEKAAWTETVENAIAEERQRLDTAHARYREEAEAEARTAAEAASAERIAELEAEQESREGQMRGQVEAHVATLLAEFDTRLVNVRNGYETRLAEQEAVLEDERRRLETECVRLREALADARQSAVPDVAVATAPAATAPALDFALDAQVAAAADLDREDEALIAAPPVVAGSAPRATPAIEATVPAAGAAATRGKSGDAGAAEEVERRVADAGAATEVNDPFEDAAGAATEIDFPLEEAEAGAEEDPTVRPAAPQDAGGVPDLTLQLDEPEPVATTAREAPASAVPELDLDLQLDEAAHEHEPEPAAPEPEEHPLPRLDLDDDETGEDWSMRTGGREAQRVIPADTLAEIRRRLEEKMRAAKRQSG